MVFDTKMRGTVSRLQLKLWLGVGIALTLGFIAVQFDHYRATRTEVVEATLAEARTLHATLVATGRVYQRLLLDADLPPADQPHGLLPIHALARMADEIGQQDPTQLRLEVSSLQSRTLDTRTDAVKAQAVAYFTAHPDADELLTPFTDAEGQHFYVYTQPIRTEPYCLACHGIVEDVVNTIDAHFQHAAGDVVGALSGITSIKLPREQLETRAKAAFAHGWRDHLLLFVALFVIGGGLLQHFIINKIRRIQAATAKLASGDYQTRLPVKGRDELADLACAFNQMADSIAVREKRLRDTHANANLGFWTLDARTGRGDWSPEIYRILAIDPSIAAGPQTLEQVLHPHDAQVVLDSLQNAIETADDHNLDYRVLRPDGLERWLHCRAWAVRDDTGRVIRLEGFVQDITVRKETERKLRAREQTLDSLFRAAPIGIGLLSACIIREVNKTFCIMLGFTREELIDQSARLLYPDDAEFERVTREKYHLIDTLGTRIIETQMCSKQGTLIDVLLSLTPHDKDNPSTATTFTALDITARNRARDALKAERAFLQNVIDGIEDPLLVIGSNFEVLRMNRVARTMAERIGTDSACLKCHQVSYGSALPCSGENHPCPLKDVFDTGMPCKRIHNHLREDGQLRTFEVAASPLRNATGQIIGIIEELRDITDHLDLLQQIQEKDLSYAHLAQHDPLTGLPNRMLFADRLSLAIHGAHRDQKSVALLFIDLDDFKQINDSFDHNYGDAVLKAVAQRLKHLFRENDTVARMGGDEFAVILTAIRNDAHAALVARKVLALFNEPFEIQGHAIVLGAGVGLSLYPQHGTSVDELVRNADTAMHRAKLEGRNTYQYYTQELTAKAFERVLLEASLRQAIVRDELVLHYQPQFDLPSGTICGLEALLRWHHPEMGLVSPARFIPLAEESGMIISIGEWVLREATGQMKTWQNAGLLGADTRISVNLSVKQFDQDNLVAMIEAVLKDTRLRPESLELEITESVMMKAPERSVQRLSRLRDLGIHVAIDDFGTGYSSLGYLKALPLTKLKIDQSFVADIPDDTNNAAITRAIIGLAKSLSLEVLAEGIETQAQLAFLMSEGCQSGQGYLLSRPLDCDALEAYLTYREVRD